MWGSVSVCRTFVYIDSIFLDVLETSNFIIVVAVVVKKCWIICVLSYIIIVKVPRVYFYFSDYF